MIQLIYKCGKCDLPEQAVSVRERQNAEGIRHWMDDVVLTLMRNHHAQRPHCDAKQFEFVKIPVSTDESKGIGQP